MADPVAIISTKFPSVVIPLLNEAKVSIRAVVFDWRFYPPTSGNEVSQFNAALLAAQRRGVEVKALVNSEGVYAKLKALGCNARRLRSSKMLHTKMLILDDVNVIIGSHNYTQSAFASNEEASVYVVMPDKDNDFVKYFDALFGL